MARRGLLRGLGATAQRVGVALALMVLATTALSTSVLAHEQHDVGKYVVEMGWRDEPALVGVLNAVALEVHDKASGRAISGLAKTVSVAVSIGGSRDSLSLAFHSTGTANPRARQLKLARFRGRFSPRPGVSLDPSHSSLVSVVPFSALVAVDTSSPT